MATTDFPLTSLLGIPFALLGAALLAFGAHYQSRGVRKVEHNTQSSASAGVSLRQLRGLLARPSWISGTALLVAATVMQLISLGLSPIIVVQPLGVVALIITAAVNARYSRIQLNGRAKTAIVMSVVGVAVFVTVAAVFASNRTVTDAKLRAVLLVFSVVLVTTLVLFAMLRKRGFAIFYILATGVLYGFVATLAKTIIGRFQQQDVDQITWLSICALIVGVLLGMFFVQTAYASGPPDLVIAGLTVIDPLVAVLVGVFILGEAQDSPLAVQAVFVLAGTIAMIGVVHLAKYHPQNQQDKNTPSKGEHNHG